MVSNICHPNAEIQEVFNTLLFFSLNTRLGEARIFHASFFYRLLFILLLLLIVISIPRGWLPFNLGPTGHNNQRAVEIIIYSLMSLSLLFSPLRRKVFGILIENKFEVVLVLALVTMLAVSSFLSEYSLKSYQEVGRLSGVLVLALVIAAAFEETFLVWLGWLVVFVAALFFVQLVVKLGFAFESPRVLNEVLIDGFSHIRSFNHVQVFLIPMLVFLSMGIARSEKKLYRSLLVILLCSQWILLFYSKGRGVFVALVIGFFVLAVFVSNLDWKRSCKFFFVPMVVGYFLYNVFFVILPEFLLQVEIAEYSSRFQSNYSRRLYLWGVALNSTFSHPWFGVGGQNFVMIDGESTEGSAHNFVINFFAEFGVLAGMTMLFLSLRIFARTLFSFSGDWGTRSSLFFALFSAAIYSFVTGILLSPLSTILFGLYAGLAIGTMSNSKDRGGALLGAREVEFGRLLICGLVALVVFCVFYTLFEIVFYKDDLDSCLGRSICYPRFWLNGDISSFGGR